MDNLNNQGTPASRPRRPWSRWGSNSRILAVSGRDRSRSRKLGRDHL